MAVARARGVFVGSFRLIMLIVLACGSLHVATTSHAQTEAERLFDYEYGESDLYLVKDYNSLMRMNSSQRMTYINGLRELLIELEKLQNKRLGASSDFQVLRLRDYLQALDLFFPEAQAQRLQSAYAMPDFSITIRQMKCPNGYSPTQVGGIPYALGRSPDPNAYRCRRNVTTAFACRNGERFYPASRGRAAYCQTSYPPTVSRPAAARPVAAAPRPAPPRAAPPPRSTVRSDRSGNREQSRGAQRGGRQPAVRAPASPQASPSALDLAAAAAGEMLAATEPILQCQGNETGTATLVTQFPPQAPPSSCNDSIIDRAKRFMRRDNFSMCIYGGNMSVYQTSITRGGTCTPPNKFCVEGPCNDPKLTRSFQPRFECRSNEIICNPLIFGIKNDGRTPFCVPKGRNATSSCDQESTAATRARHPFEQGTANTWQNVEGLAEAWNDWAQQFNHVCTFKDEGAQYFCHECHTIRKRLLELNMLDKTLTGCGRALCRETTVTGRRCLVRDKEGDVVPDGQTQGGAPPEQPAAR